MKVRDIEVGQRFAAQLRAYRFEEVEVLDCGLERTLATGKIRRDGVLVRRRDGSVRLVEARVIREPWADTVRKRQQRKAGRDRYHETQRLAERIAERIGGDAVMRTDLRVCEIHAAVPVAEIAAPPSAALIRFAGTAHGLDGRVVRLVLDVAGLRSLEAALNGDPAACVVSGGPAEDLAAVLGQDRC